MVKEILIGIENEVDLLFESQWVGLGLFVVSRSCIAMVTIPT